MRERLEHTFCRRLISEKPERGKLLSGSFYGLCKYMKSGSAQSPSKAIRSTDVLTISLRQAFKNTVTRDRSYTDE